MFNFIRKRLKLLFILGLIITVAIIVYSSYRSKTAKQKNDSVTVKRGQLVEKMTISGTIDAEEKATLRFQTSGRLSWVGVKEGDYVKKYQAIASLDQRELQKNLSKYLNDYLSERWDFDQTTKDDYRDRVMTDTVKRVLEKAQFDLNKTVLDVEVKNIALEYANLFTPIEGIVTKVGSPYAGTNVTPTQAEFEIVNPLTIYFSANADQTEVTKLSENLNGELVLDAYPEATIIGAIKNISFIPKTGETGTVYAVKFAINDDNTNYKYRLGMGGDLTFSLQEKNDVLYLPIKYVKTENGKKFVKVKKENKEEKVFVETGMETDNEVEIIKGLNEGDIVY